MPDNSNRPVITEFDIETGTERTVFAKWTWAKEHDHTDQYKVQWKYKAGSDWFIGEESSISKTSTDAPKKEAKWDPPSNASEIKFKVRPISEKYSSNNQQIDYWSAEWSTEVKMSFDPTPPMQPATPTVTCDKYNLVATLENLNTNTNYIHFQVATVKGNKSTLFSEGIVKISATHSAEYTCKVDAGKLYKVRARSVESKEQTTGSLSDTILVTSIKPYGFSDYSDWSESVASALAAPENGFRLKLLEKLQKT